MTLHWPALLLLLFLVPPLVYLRYGRHRQARMLFSDLGNFHRLPRSWRVQTAWIPRLLFALGLCCVIGALARPQKGLEESRVQADVVDIVLLVDVSTSMRAEDFSTRQTRRNRLDAAKEVIKDFISKRETDRISIVSFAALPYTVSPLTLDHTWLLSNLDRVRIGMLEDGTAIGTAIASAVNRLRDSEASTKLVILLTDGVNNAGNLNPENAALAAEALGIKVYTIGAGSDRGAGRSLGLLGIRNRAEIDEATLKKIAEITGARYFRAQDFEDLQSIYGEIDSLERTEVDVEQFKRYEERYSGWLGAALLLLLLEQGLNSTVYRRSPA